MVALAARQRLNLPAAPIAAALAGLVVAAAFMAMPADVLEVLVSDSGLPAILSAAEPPLGWKARILLSAMGGGGAALFIWFGLFLLLDGQSISLRRAKRPVADAAEEQAPAVRRADAHPDAPPRAPVLATRDLGTPFLDVKAPAKGGEPQPAAVREAPPAPRLAPLPAPRPTLAPPPEERELPANLDVPMSAYDPGALRPEPLPAPGPFAPLRRARPATIDPGERFETFELTPAVRPAPTPIREPEAPPPPEPIAAAVTDATIHALLARLEEGVARRGLGQSSAAPRQRQPEHGLEDALASLRKLAVRG